jgi:hypothetical protein
MRWLRGSGIRRVGGARAREFGVQLDVAADVDDDQMKGGRPSSRAGRGRSGRPGCGRAAWHRQSCLRAAGLELFGLQYERAAPIAVDEAHRFAAVTVAKGDAALEHVGVLARVSHRRLRRLDIQQAAEFADEELVIGTLGTADFGPAGDEAFDSGMCAHDVGIVTVNRRYRA